MAGADHRRLLSNLVWTVGLWFIFCVLGCEVSWEDRDKDSPVGAGILDREDLGKVVMSAPLEAASSSAFESGRGDLPYLLVGTAGTRTARALIKFPVVPDTFQVDAARLLLYWPYAYDWEGTSLELAVKEIDSSWEAEEVADLPNVIEDIDTIVLADTDTVVGSFIEMDFPTTLVQSWMVEEHQGALLLEASQGIGLCAFGSSEEAKGPTLALWYHTAHQDSLEMSYRTVEDTYLITEAQRTDRLLISQADPIRVQTRFDLSNSEIPPEATIVSAIFEEHILEAHTGRYKVPSITDWEPAPMELVAYVLLEPDEELELLEAVGAATIDESDSVFSISLTQDVVQDWLENPDSNYGLLLKSQYEGQSMSWLTIGPPVLTLVYSVPPTIE